MSVLWLLFIYIYIYLIFISYFTKLSHLFLHRYHTCTPKNQTHKLGSLKKIIEISRFQTNTHKSNLPCNNSNLMQLNGSCGIKLAKFSFGVVIIKLNQFAVVLR